MTHRIAPIVARLIMAALTGWLGLEATEQTAQAVDAVAAGLVAVAWLIGEIVARRRRKGAGE